MLKEASDLAMIFHDISSEQRLLGGWRELGCYRLGAEHPVKLGGTTLNLAG